MKKRKELEKRLKKNKKKRSRRRRKEEMQRSKKALERSGYGDCQAAIRGMQEFYRNSASTTHTSWRWPGDDCMHALEVVGWE